MKIFSLWSKVSLGLQLLIALILGVLTALIWPQFSAFYQFLGQAFISLINMVIIPLVFPVVVVAVAGVIGKKSFGKLLTKSLLYFFGVTTVITLIFVFAAYYLGFGQGVNIGQTGGNIDGIAKSIQLNEFFLSFIPANIVKSLSEGALLPIIVFAIFLAYGLGSLKEDKSQKFIDLLQIWIEAIYKIVGVIIKLSPIGIFGFIAKDVATTGVDKLIGLGQFVAGTYLAYVVLALVIFPLIALVFGVPYLTSIRQNWSLLTLAFVSGSSSVVLPPLLKDLKKQGHDEHVIDLVVPLGYTFNLEGAAVYFSVATIFIAHAYGIAFSISGLLFTILLLTLVGKTAATVPSGAIVVLLAAAPQLGLPVEGVALIFAVDFFVNAGRTALNVLGQALAVSVIEKTEGHVVEESKSSELAVRYS
ncbi:dicarboxylate/amino acid:cation symporter [Streptococcus gordonii]|uniref:dicarboxylate/amino acid:cation symporter n=1 Tax=Streptococcus gordonii TaxID=1302 RepID=UPI00073B2B0D|nr:dicarboxylate/amino acid:cation symporter [Streptococcus gordonii]KTF21326.1 amino acid:cation symporter [Streptococcus gordonii]KXC03664.1 amino acid:cation symporter [Streptococcus gordonii]MBZ2149437.1 dicarboxylate/amino acid:cation symporter [Streptococcus gordonii]QWZ57406.1 dicarboxylate/amino acid:cation symporter [Streptococcus gordonii]SQF27105.1 proton/sodium- glutamate symport protein [Streptococcus gordonii]